MTTRRRRDLVQSARPVSAIYIGKDPLQRTQDQLASNEPSIPESPPPPTPSRAHRQLPSPPVTLDNRSTGDSASSQAGTVGRKTNIEVTIHTENNDPPMLEYDDDDHDLNEDEDEDNTAKLSGDLRLSRSTSLQVHPGGALARVKSLAERNRELTRRLSSLSRRDTPSPTGPSTTSTSNSNPIPPVNNHQGSRLSWNSFSGSETEREPTTSTSTSSRRLNSLPPFRRSLDTARDPSPPPRTPSPPATLSRQRLISAPESPGQSHTAPANSSNAVKPSTRRRRASLDPLNQETLSVTLSRSTTRLRPDTSGAESSNSRELRDEPAATTIGRNSPLNSSRRQRQPLPNEFRDSSSRSDRLSVSDLHSTSATSISSGRSGRTSPGSRGSKAPSLAAGSTIEPPTPRTPRTYRPFSRSATVREPGVNLAHQRAESEQSSSRRSEDLPQSGRRQSLRGGSADSMIVQRSVAGESLRAAGLAGRGDDVFSQSGNTRRRLSGDLGDRPQFSKVDDTRDPRERRRSARNLGRYDTSIQRLTSRPSTSMATFQSDERSPRSGQTLLRQRTFNFPERERTSPMMSGGRQAEYSGTSRNVYTPPTPSHRKAGRNSSMRILDKGSFSTPDSEHAKLMLDSLSMFESHLARLPTNSNASLSATTIPDLYHNAQSVVQSANTLNILLREANTHALDEQIEAEIREANDDVDVSEIWRAIGSEYRESLRVSDELVRTMTGFLLGMGKILREATVIREPMVDEEGRVNSPNGSHGSAGRRSNDGRRSLDFPPVETSPRERERYRDESLRRIATQANRAPSVLGAFRQQVNSDDERGGDSTERPQRSAISGLSVRRMFSAKNGRPKSSSDAANKPLWTENTSMRAPVAIPPPLETLPSETLIQRSPSGKSVRRRKGTVAAGTAKTSFPSFFSSSQPTTAVTPTTVGNAQEKKEFPLQRTISSTSASTLSFARSSETAANELQKRFDTDTRMRSSSTSSTLDSERMAAVILPGEPGEPADDRVFRASVDAPSSAASTVHNRTYAERKDRRRTVTEVFSRVN